MKVAYDLFHLDGERGFRGGERQLLYLAAALRARGHRNVVVCRAGSELEDQAKRQGFETANLPFLFEWDPLSAIFLRALARKSARPILHAHTGHTAALACLAAASGGLARVAHRRVDFETSGGLSQTLKYGRAGKVVAVSQAIAKVLERSGVSAAKISVVADGVPVDAEECDWAMVPPGRFAPASAGDKAAARKELAEEFSLPADHDWVGNLAALVPHKDHDTLLAAALIVLLKRPKTIFLIAGKGPEGPRLVGEIKRMGLLGKVLIVDHRPDPVPLLKALDVFVLSSWGEGMGSVLLEASACALPIAATTAGGIPEIVSDGATGLLAPPREPEALAAAIVKLLADRTLAKRLGDKARAELPRFGLKRMAREMEAVYEGVFSHQR